jgi:hypothetical protein
VSNRRQPVAYLDVTHSDAAASQAVAASQRRRYSPEAVAPEPLPAPSLADVQRSGKAPTTKTPPAPGRSPAPSPSPDRGGRLNPEALERLAAQSRAAKVARSRAARKARR